MVTADRAAGDFGAKMRRAREGRGISLRQIAAATKISPVALEALERNDISRLPGGIFSRAFVRSYALEVGLDPEGTVREFLAQFPHDSVTAGSPHVPQEDHAAIESDRQSAQTALKLVAMSVPLVAAILYFTVWAGPTAALTFELLVTSPVRLEVGIDGVRRAARQAEPGERLIFEAEHELTLAISDAAAVQLSINGQPAAPLGLPGETRTLQVGRANYATFLASR